MSSISEDSIPHIQELLDEDIRRTEIARMLGVATKTLYRFIAKHGLVIPQFSDITDDDLVEVVRFLKRNHPNDGEALMHGHLMSKDIKVQRWRLRAAIHAVDDKEVVEGRKSRSIRRRKYTGDLNRYNFLMQFFFPNHDHVFFRQNTRSPSLSIYVPIFTHLYTDSYIFFPVPSPMYILHIDGNHKLIKWKFVSHFYSQVLKKSVKKPFRNFFWRWLPFCSHVHNYFNSDRLFMEVSADSPG